MTTYYKLARPNGWDYFTGRIINYRAAIGSMVRAPDYANTRVCGQGLHYSRNPLDCFQGTDIPCSAYEVEPVGRKHVAINKTKSKAESLRIMREITDLDALFGFNYTEAANPVHPFSLTPPEVANDVLALLRQWDSVGNSVWDSVRASVRDSVGNSVWDSVGASVRDSVGDSVWTSVGDSVWTSAGDSVWTSVRDSVRAYIGFLFPGITTWKYIDHEPGVYPFQPAADLWRMGLVPSFNGKLWRLHGHTDARILWEGTP